MIFTALATFIRPRRRARRAQVPAGHCVQQANECMKEQTESSEFDLKAQ